MTRQEERDQEQQKSFDNQLKYRPRCLLQGLARGICEGPLHTFSSQGHGLCRAHEEKVRKDRRVELGNGFFIEVEPGDPA